VRARGVVRITPDDVGGRITVRARIAHSPGEPGMSDTVGVLESWEDGVLRIRRRDGSLAHVPEAALVAGRRISP
jgi:hypothetical protein